MKLKTKTSDLTGPALDWAVAKCEGHQWRSTWILEKEGYKAWASYEEAWGNPHPSYSTDWSEGGPIIEREGIALHGNPPAWCAQYSVAVRAHHGGYRGYFRRVGPTPLIAAMRCFVASKLGDTIDIPEELV